MVYGVLVYAVMNYVVVPLSAAPKLRFGLVSFVGQLLAHIIAIGPLIALINRRSARKAAGVAAFTAPALNQLDSAA
jgi:hypothetical protein